MRAPCPAMVLFHIRRDGSDRATRRKTWNETGRASCVFCRIGGTPYAVTSPPIPHASPRVVATSRTAPAVKARTVSTSSPGWGTCTTPGKSRISVSTSVYSTRPYSDHRPRLCVPSARTASSVLNGRRLRPNAAVTAVKPDPRRRVHEPTHSSAADPRVRGLRVPRETRAIPGCATTASAAPIRGSTRSRARPGRGRIDARRTRVL